MGPEQAKSTIRADTAERHRRKYTSRNPLQRFVLDRFFVEMADTLQSLQPANALEFGCGEGFFLERLDQLGVRLPNLTGVDLRADAIAEARQRCPYYRFEVQDLLSWDVPERSFDAVIASQVLEHLPEPGRFLERLVALCRGRLILSVPFEPWFRLLNLARGRDLRRWGNHPEHVNQWGMKTFTDFVARYAHVEQTLIAFPFNIVIARPHDG
jgi:2-polyprenyl-3-methyl-5-hydroxy-6-metoxy-1,4-benzoquinol methylase